MASTQKWLPIYVHWRWDKKLHYRANNPCISRVNTFLNQNTDAFTACASYDTQKLGTLVNGIPPLHFRWKGSPICTSGEFWSMGSPLCTSGEWGVPSLHFGQKGPPLHFGEWGLPFALWSMGSPLCTLVNGVPPLHFGQWGPPFALQVNFRLNRFSDEGPSLKTLDLFYQVSTPTL